MDIFYTDLYLSEFKVYKMNMNKRLLFKRKNYKLLTSRDRLGQVCIGIVWLKNDKKKGKLQ